MFKQTMLAVAVAMALIGTAQADNSFERLENTVSVNAGPVTVYGQFNLNSPTREVGIKYDIDSNFYVGYARGEGEVVDEENRLFGGARLSYGPFYGQLEIQWSEYEHSGVDDYMTVLPTVGVQHKIISTKFVPYLEVTPNLTYSKNGNDNFTEIDETNFRLGVKYDLTDKVNLGTYVQLDTDSDWNHKETFLGTAVNVKF